MNRNILFALKTEKVVMFIILTLIVLVAAFGIASTLFMVVMEKNRDIAILKSMGATGGSIMKIFVLEGLVIGIIGTALGVVSGLLIALNLEPIICVYPEDYRPEFLQQGYLLPGPLSFDGGAFRRRADFRDSGADLVCRHALSGLASLANAAGRGAAL